MNVVFPCLYAILDADLLKTSEWAFAEGMAESGVELLQYRNKRVTSRQFFDAARSIAAVLSRLAQGSSAPLRFIVNDRPDVALLTGAGGVHVGQTDLSVADARAIVGKARWVGVSTHTLEQVEEAEKSSADYVAFGPVFPTATKENHDPIVGLEMLTQARKRTSKPLVAIGGITLERAAETYRAGADSLAVARDLISSADPQARARAFLQIGMTVARPARPKA